MGEKEGCQKEMAKRQLKGKMCGIPGWRQTTTEHHRGSTRRTCTVGMRGGSKFGKKEKCRDGEQLRGGMAVPAGGARVCYREALQEAYDYVGPK